ncbi:MAG TPA: Ig-like domain-containing protein [Thermoanaerobaculia bacterium]|nr:Ig-like domain-containing protein [Thermoanaerobaculia bacterium]
MSKLSTAALVLLAALAVASGGACRRADATRPDVPADRVTISTPQDWAMFAAGDDITVEAAIEMREPVQRVEFWTNGGVFRTLDRPPFRMTIPKAGAGSYRIHAVAYTAHGKLASKQVYVGVRMREEDRMRELTVEESAALIGGAEPRIFIDAPTPGTTLRAPADISIEGWAVFPAAQMKDITILGDGKPLVAFTSSPFKHVWRGVGKGRHVVAIQAVDVDGRTMQQSETVDVQ